MNAPAGWYRDPNDASSWRYWDGDAWTEHRAPLHETSEQPSTNEGIDTVSENEHEAALAYGDSTRQT